MSGYDLPPPSTLDPATGLPVVINKATVLRIQLTIPASGPPKVTGQTVIASGLAQRSDKDVFLIGPTGLALIGGTLYVSDAIENRIVAIPDAASRGGSAGTGRTVTKDGLLQRPLALAATANGHILACNGKNGQVVEFDPRSGQQLAAQWVDSNQAQSPPGNGDLFGLAMAPDGSGFYYVEDDTNMLAKATQ
jgi:DNA-binding beta-propeller fold protein YncE